MEVQIIEADSVVGRLNSILRQKLSLLNKIYDLSAQAVNYISEDCVERLNNIYIEKMELTREIDSLDGRFLRLYDEFKAGRKQGAPAELSELKQNTSKILETLRKISAFDVGVNAQIAKLRESITADLNRIRKQKQISSIYGGGVRSQNHNGPDYAPAMSGVDIKN